MDVRIYRHARDRSCRRLEHDVVVARIRVRMPLRSRSVVAKLKEPEGLRLAHDRAADLLADLAGEGLEHVLRLLPPTPRQHVRALILEHEDHAVLRREHRANRDDQLKRRLLIGEEARENERGYSPNDVPGRYGNQIPDPAQ